MAERINPYYNPEHFGLTMRQFDDPESSYDFNTLVFWATTDGRVFTASDSGCSCPVPFETYEAESVDELLPGLERVGSVEQARRIFDAWNVGWDDKPMRPASDGDELERWVREHLP